ncbi:hypothetical protein TSMEX_009986 [Taenia solium]
MMRIITILAFVTYCSGANPPKLWGSRVVSKKSGPSDSMYYKFDGEYNAYINHGSQTSRLSIIDGKCLIDETRVWGSPCREGARDATITLADVTAQDNLIITEKRPHPRISSTTFFVPQCKFRRPGPVNLVKYKEADLRIFRGVFTRKPGATHESFTFSGNRTLVVVSVDYSQSDEIFAVLIMVLLKSN